MAKQTNTSLPSSSAYEAAADWLLRQEMEPDALTCEAFEAWLYENPDHVTAYNEVANTWAASPAIVTHAAPHTSVEPMARLKRTAPYWLVGGAAGGGAIAAGIAVAVVMLNSTSWEESPVLTQEYATQIGEIGEYQLADASTLVLDTASIAEVSYSDQAREVNLEAGQVFVDVTSDPQRPFTVMAQDYRFTALGTAYAVAYEEEGLRLEVYEGVVEMAGASFGSTRIEAGHGLNIRADRITRFDVAGHLTATQPDWTQSRITLNNISVEDAVTAFSPYAPFTIEVQGEQLKTHTISGRFDLSDARGFIRTLSAVTHAELDESDPTHWVLKGD